MMEPLELEESGGSSYGGGHRPPLQPRPVNQQPPVPKRRSKPDAEALLVKAANEMERLKSKHIAAQTAWQAEHAKLHEEKEGLVKQVRSLTDALSAKTEEVARLSAAPAKWDEEKEHLLSCIGRQMDQERALKAEVKAAQEREEGWEREVARYRRELEKAGKLEEAVGQLTKKVGVLQERVASLTAEKQAAQRAHSTAAAEIAELHARLAEEQEVQQRLVDSLQAAQTELETTRSRHTPPAKGGSGTAVEVSLSALHQEVASSHASLSDQIQALYQLMLRDGVGPRVYGSPSASVICDEESRTATLPGVRAFQGDTPEGGSPSMREPCDASLLRSLFNKSETETDSPSTPVES